MSVAVSLHWKPGVGALSSVRDCAEFAKVAEDAGIHSVHLSDHILIGPRTDRYPYGTLTADEHDGWPEPVTVLAAMAAATTRIRLGVHVLLAPLRPAPLLAKSIATLDAISGGRTELGVGVGWQREEYESLGIDWASRHVRFADGIRACRALWNGKVERFDSSTVQLREVSCYPRPIQERIPILFGMRLDERTRALLVEDGDGWCPHMVPLDELRASVGELRQEFARAGRDPAGLVVRAAPPHEVDDAGRYSIERTFAGAHRYVDAGVNVLVVGPPRGYDTVADLRSFARMVSNAAREFGGLDPIA